MINPLVAKLEQYTRLSAEDRAALDRATAARTRRFGPREDIVREDAAPEAVNVMLSGWACRYKQLEDGRRQILNFFLPGDLCDFNVFVLRRTDHSIAALTRTIVAQLSRESFDALTIKYPRVAQALWWETLVGAAVQREWTVNLGQRTAFERIAHLLCELFLRLRGVGLTNGQSCDFPITQTELTDATGISAVHVNRTLQDLRAAELIILRDRTLTIPDLPSLMRACLYNPNYLHIDREGAHLDANK